MLVTRMVCVVCGRFWKRSLHVRRENSNCFMIEEMKPYLITVLASSTPYRSLMASQLRQQEVNMAVKKVKTITAQVNLPLVPWRCRRSGLNTEGGGEVCLMAPELCPILNS